MAQADAQRRDPDGMGVRQQGAQPREPGVLNTIMRGHPPAQDEHAVPQCGDCWDLLLPQIHLVLSDARVGQPAGHAAGRASGIELEDRDARGPRHARRIGHRARRGGRRSPRDRPAASADPDSAAPGDGEHGCRASGGASRVGAEGEGGPWVRQRPAFQVRESPGITFAHIADRGGTGFGDPVCGDGRQRPIEYLQVLQRLDGDDLSPAQRHDLAGERYAMKRRLATGPAPTGRRCVQEGAGPLVTPVKSGDPPDEVRPHRARTEGVMTARTGLKRS